MVCTARASFDGNAVGTETEIAREGGNQLHVMGHTIFSEAQPVYIHP